MKIGVIGGGAWGTALAQVAAAKGEETLLWAREPEVVAAIKERRENSLFLPGIPLSADVRPTSDIGDLARCDAVLVVAPAQHLGSVLASLPPLNRPLILCAKGIEEGSGRLMNEVARNAQPSAPLAVLSGPTFAHEVARGLPTAVTLAVEDNAMGVALRDRLALPHFRPYLSDDIVGAEIGGAVKNVLAIACGVVDGRGLGLNARASLISRGFAEMTRFGLALGGRLETLAGLSGLGDLVLTCSSENSRNFSFGKGLGQGLRADALMKDRLTVAEGVFTAPVLQRVARKAEVDMPIVDAVCALISGTATAGEVVDQLLARPLRTEGA